MGKIMREPKSFWSRLKSGMKNMPTKEEGMLNLKFGNTRGLNIWDFKDARWTRPTFHCQVRGAL